MKKVDFLGSAHWSLLLHGAPAAESDSCAMAGAAAALTQPCRARLRLQPATSPVPPARPRRAALAPACLRGAAAHHMLMFHADPQRLPERVCAQEHRVPTTTMTTCSRVSRRASSRPRLAHRLGGPACCGATP